jgi:hypothetical protein
MKKAVRSLIFAVTVFLILNGAASACLVVDREPNLFNIWNGLFGDDQVSSRALFREHGVKGKEDALWTDSGAGWNLYAEARYSRFRQAFGYRIGGADTVLKSGIARGLHYETEPIHFSPDGTFSFFERYKTPGGQTGMWYSDRKLNRHREDHFIALAVPDALVRWYNTNNGDRPDLTGDVYLLAFEDLRLRRSDRDFNDLVLLVSRESSTGGNGGGTVTPIPGAAWLLGSGLLAMAALRRMGMRARRTA